MRPDRLVVPWAGVVLGEPVELGGSVRSTVHRCRVVEGPAAWGESVVVKRFVPAPPGSRAAMGYEREVAGLSHLPGVPALLASDDATRTLVLEDLGVHPTLADVLLDPHAQDAWRHTVRWAAALGRAVSADPRVLADARLRLGEAGIQDRQVRRDQPRQGLTRLQEVTGLRDVRAATAQLLDVVDRLEGDTARHVLGPGDACPDNAVLTPAGVRLLDLEGTGVRHVALEAAYAAEPFSTCWCVFTPPQGLTDQTLSAFTAAAEPALPGLAADPDWLRQVRSAVACWVLAGTLWLLDGAVADRTMAPAGRQGPGFRALLLARWGWVARECSGELPAVAAVCEEAVGRGRRAWREGSALDLPGYPAFRGR
ncbi:hypothetical protein ACQE98_14760 [Ornithinimicrobium sp. W1679]|uniref:hypothetical protein n=1 Tax=unclassified Ornithinimicrobium TaxID=2615080 RepID=UPI003CF093E8